MKTYFSFFRWPNLLIIILLQYLLKAAVFEKFLEAQGYSFPISDFWFAILVISTVFIAIGGYIANDLADVEIDKINRPSRALAMGKISFAQARSMQWFFEIIGFLLGLSVAIYVQCLLLAAIHLFIIFLMRVYSKRLKCKGIQGNSTVAFTTAMVPAIVWIFTQFAMQDFFPAAAPDYFTINLLVAFYIGFAYWFTLIREIVKDLEDLKGDRELGCNTLAVSQPLQKTKNLVMIFGAIGISGILLFQWALLSYLSDEIMFLANFASIIVVTFSSVIFKTISANSSYDFHRIGISLKIIMVAGILQMIFLLC